ncbi:MAG: amidophosphoribosyltransferase [Alphaproteobacteria bacterium]|nr:amidophosphoribosyltransferase [Alphaproteobacteria bacterium]
MLTTSPYDYDDDHLREECGVFAIYHHKDASALTALGLHALQHRGQEAAGIVTHDGEHFHAHHALGHVGKNFNKESVIRRLMGNKAIGHNRYATTGETALRNVQPFFADFEFGGFALGHNGNLTNAYSLRKDLIKRGSLFHSTTDTEVVIHLMAQSEQQTPVDRLIDAVKRIEGAYSLVCLAPDCIMGVRDPLGLRPLVLGKLGDAHVLASETCALDIIGAEFVRDIEAGELVILNEQGVSSFRPFEQKASRFCVFEYIYFARPDSFMQGRSVYEVRKRIGMELAREYPVDADLVVPVPDSGVPAAIGYAAQSGLPFELGIIRNHYVGRTFIEPSDQIRHLGVRLKHNANRAMLEGKRVILIDDSIVRGTTSTKIVEMVRQAGAKEVHMRISSPPTKFSCFYGIDTPEKEKLMAHKYSVDEMAKLIGADSLAFISLDGLYRAAGEQKRDPEKPSYCDACFSGEYPTVLTDLITKMDDQQLSFLNSAAAE